MRVEYFNGLTYAQYWCKAPLLLGEDRNKSYYKFLFGLIFLFLLAYTLGTGSFVRCVETVAERPPLIMGKPSEKMFTVISEKYQLKPSRTLMIGDR